MPPAALLNAERHEHKRSDLKALVKRLDEVANRIREIDHVIGGAATDDGVLLHDHRVGDGHAKRRERPLQRQPDRAIAVLAECLAPLNVGARYTDDARENVGAHGVLPFQSM